MKKKSPVVGILALQGDYQKHQQILDKIGVSHRPVRQPDDFQVIDRLIVPGGESTVIAELLERLDIRQPFGEFIKRHPVWGTCAGMILLASAVDDGTIAPYKAIDITVQRNGYGRQIHSATVQGLIELNGHREELELVFIRAPRVIHVGQRVNVLMTWETDPILLSQNEVLVSSFHPELSDSVYLHEFFSLHFGNQKNRSRITLY